MGWLSGMVGIFGSIFQIGESGPKLKDTGSALEVRNAGDTAAYPLIADQNTISPPALVGTTNDYAPTGIEGVGVLRIASGGNRTLTGIQAPSPERVQVIYLVNIDAGTLTLADNNVGSLAANRFLLGGNITLATDEGIALFYDRTSNRWRATQAE